MEFFLALATSLPNWILRRPVDLTGWLPVQKAKCRVAPEVQQYDTKTLYHHLIDLRQQPKDNYNKVQRISATVAVFRRRDTDEPEILLLQSRRWWLPWGRSWGGKWEMTGGGVDIVPNETILQAAEREAKDEADIMIESIDACVGHYYFYCGWMLWIAHNAKIMFIGQVKDGDAGLQNIKLNSFEHEKICWAKEKHVAAMSDEPMEQLKLKMDGNEAKPTDDQWPKMQYISKEGHQLALLAFEKLREQKAKKT